MKTTVPLALAALTFLGCSSSDESPADDDAAHRRDVAAAMHDVLLVEIEALHRACLDLQAAAPNPRGRGWSGKEDAAAIGEMRAAFRRARIAYEHIEGAMAPIFPDIDQNIDARYDDFLSRLGGAGDRDLFDGEGVIGMHAVERILWADAIPTRVVDFEKTLPGYGEARFPANEGEAAAFKAKLVQRLLDDVAFLETEWRPARIDIGAAFQGLIALMNEQKEKVDKAATGEEESRYAQMTLFDLRNNLAGTRRVYDLFRPWILGKPGGASADERVLAGMSSLMTTYDGYVGDLVPEPPPTWSSDAPTAADLATPFGRLYSAVHGALDPTKEGSVVHEMNVLAETLGFGTFRE
jgi:iron uptake system component EfeO